MMHARHSRRLQAFTLLEVITVAAMLGVVLGIAAQMLASVRLQAQAAEHQAIVMRTVENCLERLTTLPWQELQTGQITSSLLPAEFRSRWPEAELAGEVAISDDPVLAKQITLSLSLSSLPRARVTRLTTWVYRNPQR
jgi:prepilin-type N-terminal cleavage/methylation domain-containing protein